MCIRDSRHLGAFTAAYGVGLLVVAIRPARARTMLPVAAVLAGALLITAVVDMLNGHVPLVGEVQHLPELLSVVLVWLLALPAPRRGARRIRPSQPTLGIGPLRPIVHPLDAGQFHVIADVPLAGTYRMVIRVRVSDFVAAQATSEVTITE